MYFLGVDLGGTHIAAGVVNEEGKILVKDSVPTNAKRPYEEIFSDMADLCEKLINDAKIIKEEIHSIGIGTPGYIDAENGVILYASNLNFKNVPARDLLRQRFNVPIILENDANCAALGENVSGAARGCQNSITVTLGTGIGGGIIVNGKIYSGAFGGAGEIGHHIIVAGGEKCTCGRKGCFEAYSSATALIRDAKVSAKSHQDSKIYELCGGNLDNINAKIVFDAYNLKDPEAVKLVDNYIYYLSEGLVNIIHILEPEVMVIGGGVSLAGESLFEPLKKSMQNTVYGAVLRTEVKPATLGNDAGIIGAAMLGKQ